jgi:hypothetical protein
MNMQGYDQPGRSPLNATPWVGYGRRPWAETKPFFLTSEFLTFAGVLAALAIALGVNSLVDGFRGWLLITILASAYIVSRGIAKAGARDPNPDRLGQQGGMGYGDMQAQAYAGQMQQGAAGAPPTSGAADSPLARERY